MKKTEVKFSRGDIVMVINDDGTCPTYKDAFDYFMGGTGYNFKSEDLPKEGKGYMFVREGVHGLSLDPIYFIADIDTKQVFIMKQDSVVEYEEPIKEGDRVLFELDKNTRESLKNGGNVFGISLNHLLDLVNKEYTVTDVEGESIGVEGIKFILPLKHLKKVR